MAFVTPEQIVSRDTLNTNFEVAVLGWTLKQRVVRIITKITIEIHFLILELVVDRTLNLRFFLALDANVIVTLDAHQVTLRVTVATVSTVVTETFFYKL